MGTGREREGDGDWEGEKGRRGLGGRERETGTGREREGEGDWEGERGWGRERRRGREWSCFG